jgi:hypothetical protein
VRNRLDPHQLAALTEQPPWTNWFGDGNLLLMDVTPAGRGVVTWELRVFDRVANARYRLHAEDIHEISFPVERIRTALEKLYSRVWIYDARRSRPTAKSERLHFVCRA